MARIMWKRLAMLAALVAAVVAVYLPSIDGEFVFDDTTIVRNPLVLDPFGHGVSPWVKAGRPLTTFTFAINHLVVGLDPHGWHLTNVAIHAGAVILAWQFCRLTLARAGFSRPDGPALVAAGLFALHPLQTESVAYVSQRAESLASGIYLAALLLLLARDEAATRWRGNGLLAGAVALHVLGLAAKPIAATLPGAWLLHCAMVPTGGEAGAPAWRRVWRRLPASLPLFALSAVAAVQMTAETAGSPSAGFDIPGVSPSLNLATQSRVIPTYLRLLAWPAGQCADWSFPATTNSLEPAVLASAALLGTMIAGSVVASVRCRNATGERAAMGRAASFGALFFFLLLAPSSLVPLRDRLAEHRVYLASLGVFLAVAVGAAFVLRRLAGSRAAVVGAALSCVVLPAAGVATARRNEVWKSAVALWSDAAAKSPDKARVHLNLGDALFRANRPEDALASFLRARALHDHTLDDKLFRNIVVTLAALSRHDEARAEIERDMATFPGDPDTLALLAEVEFAGGRYAESERAAREALNSDPSNGVALKFLAMVRLRRGDVAGAREAFRVAAARNVLDTYGYLKLGEAEERVGTIGAACAAYARAAALPGNARVSAAARVARTRLSCR